MSFASRRVSWAARPYSCLSSHLAGAHFVKRHNHVFPELFVFDLFTDHIEVTRWALLWFRGFLQTYIPYFRILRLSSHSWHQVLNSRHFIKFKSNFVSKCRKATHLRVCYFLRHGRQISSIFLIKGFLNDQLLVKECYCLLCKGTYGESIELTNHLIEYLHKYLKF